PGPAGGLPVPPPGRRTGRRHGRPRDARLHRRRRAGWRALRGERPRARPSGLGLVWTTGSDTVPLNPLSRFPEGGSAELYYEVHGLATGAPYHTVVRLEREGGRSLFHRLFGGGQAPVLFEFDAPADGPVTRVRRAVDLRDAA